MNDKLEIQYAYNDSDRFACFNGSSIESFGMWSMYGGIGSYVGDIVDRTPNDAYVKISIPFSSIKKLVKDDNSISIRKIGYANINDLLLDRKRQLGTIYCGSCNNHKSDSRNINIRDRILSGYIKDYVWKYENEIRLVTKNEFINIEPIINDFEVIPSPSSSVQECNAIFYRLSENLEMKAVPKFVNNKYKDVVIIK